MIVLYEYYEYDRKLFHSTCMLYGSAIIQEYKIPTPTMYSVVSSSLSAHSLISSVTYHTRSFLLRPVYLLSLAVSFPLFLACTFFFFIHSFPLLPSG